MESQEYDALMRRLLEVVVRMDAAIDGQREMNARIMMAATQRQDGINERLTAAIERLDITQARIETILKRASCAAATTAVRRREGGRMATVHGGGVRHTTWAWQGWRARSAAREAQYALIASPYTATVCATHACRCCSREAAVLGKAMALLARRRRQRARGIGGGMPGGVSDAALNRRSGGALARRLEPGPHATYRERCWCSYAETA